MDESRIPTWLVVGLVIVAIILLIRHFGMPVMTSAEGFKYTGSSSGYIQDQSLSTQAAEADTPRVITGRLPPGDSRGLFGVNSRTLISTHPQAWRTTIYNTLPATSATVFS